MCCVLPAKCLHRRPSPVCINEDDHVQVCSKDLLEGHAGGSGHEVQTRMHGQVIGQVGTGVLKSKGAGTSASAPCAIQAMR